MIDVAYINETDHTIENYINIINRIADRIAVEENVEDREYEAAIIFVEQDKIKSINRDYREKDKVTDVISFALLDALEPDVMLNDGIKSQLGDIFISLDQAIIQAEEYGHSLEREIGFLACHGFLHLLGYDHQTKQEEDIMFHKQEMILNEIGLRRE